MTGFKAGFSAIAAGVAFWPALLMAPGAHAQTVIDAGRTAPQLFASDCTPCHKSPAGLAKSAGFGLNGFLRQHYTASRETADLLTKYLQAAGEGQPSARPAAQRRSKDAKPAAAKPAEKPAEATPSDKPAEAKPEPKPAESKSAEKPAEVKPAEAKPAEAKPAE